jgi:type IX secretion system PorP/SprF family membrane protein
MRFKKLQLIFFLLIFAGRLPAQQEPLYSQYMFNMLAINPAYAGSHEVFAGTALFRKQWVGVPGAPQTTTLGLDIPNNTNSLGFGVQLINDQIGIQNTNSFMGSVAYHSHLFSKDDQLSVGLQAGLSNYHADYNQVDLIQSFDIAFSGIIVNQWLPNFGVGVLYSSEKFYLGFSAPSLLYNRLNSDPRSNTSSAASGLSIPHYFIASGYLFTLSDDLKFKPSVLIKAVLGAPVNIDCNANLYINDLVSIGASYRTGSSFVGMATVKITPEITFGYAYDRDITNIRLYTTGSHEIMLHYELSGDKKIANPRFRYY